MHIIGKRTTNKKHDNMRVYLSKTRTENYNKLFVKCTIRSHKEIPKNSQVSRQFSTRDYNNNNIMCANSLQSGYITFYLYYAYRFVII
jgi:hypothetical protein